MGLPRHLRLNSRAVFNRLLKGPKASGGALGFLLTLPKLPQHQALPTQLAFVISKKVHKRANRRNLLRRRLQVVFQTALQQYPDMQAYRAWVCVLRPGATEASFAELQTFFQQQLKHALRRNVKPLRQSAMSALQ
jgi:ribonuclease P protein component